MRPRRVQGYVEEDYILFDCPGQIELYSHSTVFRSFVEYLRREGWSVAAVYCIDSQFAAEPAKFVAGALQARRSPCRAQGATGKDHICERDLHAYFRIGEMMAGSLCTALAGDRVVCALAVRSRVHAPAQLCGGTAVPMTWAVAGRPPRPWCSWSCRTSTSSPRSTC